MISPDDLQTVQNRLAALHGPESYYTKTYSLQEYCYWSKCFNWLSEHFNDLPDGPVADIGSAYGTLAAWMATKGRDVYCFDLIRYLTPEILNEYHLHYIAPWDAETDKLISKANQHALGMPYRFGIILFTEVLEHLNFHPLPTLKKLYRALQPGGLLVLSTPDGESTWGRVLKYYQSLDEMPQPGSGRQTDKGEEHVWQYTTEELLKLVTDAGFRVVQFDRSPLFDRWNFNLILRRPL